MKENNSGELIAKEINNGTVILFDHKEGGGHPCLPGNVEKVIGEIIHFTSGMVRKIEECAPMPIDESWLIKYGVNRNSLPAEIKYVHQLQNHLGNNPKNNQIECMGCASPWGWNDREVFDFNISTGKRIWVAICVLCRENLERKYKSKELSLMQLNMEFSNISARISKKCAVKDSIAVEKLKEFKPTRRGK